jgi:hypothetical protein
VEEGDWAAAKGSEPRLFSRAAVKKGASLLRSTTRPSVPTQSHRPPSSIMVLLVTSDNEQFVVDKDVAERSVLIKNMLEGQSPLRGVAASTAAVLAVSSTRSMLTPVSCFTDVGESDQPIPLPNVSSSVLKKVRAVGLGPPAAAQIRWPGARVLRAPPRRAASGRPTSASGTRSSSPLTRRCSSRSSSPPTTSTSSRCCMRALRDPHCIYADDDAATSGARPWRT